MRLFKKQHGIARTTISIIFALAAIGFVGYVSWNAWQTNKKAETSTDSESTQSGQPTEESGGFFECSETPFMGRVSDVPDSVGAFAGWKMYTSAREPSLSFYFPADWKVELGSSDISGVNSPDCYLGDNAMLTSPAGSKLYWDARPSGLGGGCDPASDPHVFYDSVDPISTAENFFVVQSRQLYKGVDIKVLAVMGPYGAGDKPKVGDTGECIDYYGFQSKTDEAVGLMFLQAPYLKDSDITTVKSILGSLHY